MSVERSPELNELAGALCAAQAEFTAIPKDSTNPFFKSAYAGLPKVVEVASPILTKHGLSVSQLLGRDEDSDTLTTMLLHKSGQFLADSMRLHLTKVDAQGHGSATTYGRRYAYMAILGLVADDDDDGNKASHRQQNGGQQAKQPTAAPVKDTERVASAKQRGLINVRAAEGGIEASLLANIVLVATDNEPREFASEDAALEWLKRGMDRLPASAVGKVLENIEVESKVNKMVADAEAAGAPDA